MPITLEEDRPRVSTPVVKRQRIGEHFVGAIVRVEQRDMMKKSDDGVWTKETWSDGNAKQEFVVHCLSMPETTAEASIGEVGGIPEPGTEVRLIINKGWYKEWKELRKTHRGGTINVGDIVTLDIEFAQAYGADKRPSGDKITDQAKVNKLPRSTVVGFYGPLGLSEGTDLAWIDKAETAYHAWKATTAIKADDGPFDDTEEQF